MKNFFKWLFLPVLYFLVYATFQLVLFLLSNLYLITLQTYIENLIFSSTIFYYINVLFKGVYYFISHAGGAFVATVATMLFAPKYNLRVGYTIVCIIAIISICCGLEIYLYQNKFFADLMGLLVELVGSIIAVFFYRQKEKKNE